MSKFPFAPTFLAGGGASLDAQGKVPFEPPAVGVFDANAMTRNPGGKQGGATINGGVPSAAGPMGSGVPTNPLIAARFTPSIELNPFTVIGNSTNRRGWQSVHIDRPMIMYRLNSAPAAIAFDINGLLLYAPVRKPSDDSYALRSCGYGMAYFSGPGVWWYKLNDGDGSAGGAASKQCDYVLIDASDPGVAMRLLGEAGTNGTVQTHITFTNPTAASNIVTRNVLRRAIYIQLLTPSMPIRLTFNDQTQFAGIPSPNAAVGIRMGGTGPTDLILTGDTLCKGHIQAILDFGVAGPAEVEALEFI